MPTNNERTVTLTTNDVTTALGYSPAIPSVMPNEALNLFVASNKLTGSINNDKYITNSDWNTFNRKEGETYAVTASMVSDDYMTNSYERLLKMNPARPTKCQLDQIIELLKDIKVQQGYYKAKEGGDFKFIDSNKQGEDAINTLNNITKTIAEYTIYKQYKNKEIPQVTKPNILLTMIMDMVKYYNDTNKSGDTNK